MCLGGWWCNVDWAVVASFALVLVGLGQIAAIAWVGWWAWTSANRQITEVREATETQQKHFQATLNQRDEQQRVGLAFSLVRLTYAKQSYPNIQMSPLEAAEQLQVVSDLKMHDLLKRIDSDIKERVPVSKDQRILFRRTHVACIVMSNHFGEAINLLSRDLVDFKLVYALLGGLAREALPILRALDWMGSKPQNVAIFVQQADRFAQWQKDMLERQGLVEQQTIPPDGEVNSPDKF
jgi:hypothetical protein